MASDRILEDLARIAEQVERSFKEERRLLSFREYLSLFASDPVRHSRDAARYVRDMFDYFGRVPAERPWGSLTRFRLFDLPFLDAADQQREALVGQEAV
jgi:serine protein kinase